MGGEARDKTQQHLIIPQCFTLITLVPHLTLHSHSPSTSVRVVCNGQGWGRGGGKGMGSGDGVCGVRGWRVDGGRGTPFKARPIAHTTTSLTSATSTIDIFNTLNVIPTARGARPAAPPSARPRMRLGCNSARLGDEKSHPANVPSTRNPK